MQDKTAQEQISISLERNATATAEISRSETRGRWHHRDEITDRCHQQKIGHS